MLSILQGIILLLPTIAMLTRGANATSFPRVYERDASTGHGTITTTTNGRVVRATINNPPINLYDHKLITDLFSFLTDLSTANAPKVVIFESANPEWFMTHIDVNLLQKDAPPTASQLIATYVETADLLASLPVIFIGQVSGRAFGAGSELLIQFDMRFAGPGARMGQLEVGVGLTAGNRGIQYLTKLVGRARAFEYLLSAGDVDAETAAAIGWVNTAYSSTEEMRAAVDALAHRIATFPKAALNATKVGVNENKPSKQSVTDDLARFENFLSTTDTQNLIGKVLELSGNQTNGAFELGLTQDLVDLYA